MKPFILGVVLALLWVVTPFRLMALGTEMMFVHPGAIHDTLRDDLYWQALELEARIEALGWSVTYARHLSVGNSEAYGLTVPQVHGIAVDATLHWNARAAVLAHEMGHTLQPAWANAIEGDCFAESVATLVMRDGLRDHARFMAGARWTCLGFLITEFPAIYNAAAVLTD